MTEYKHIQPSQLELIAELLGLVKSHNDKIEAMKLSQLYYQAHRRDETGKAIDWHECSWILELMERRGILEHVGTNYGLRVYKWKV